MPLLRLFKIMLRVTSGYFMLFGVLGTLDGLYLLARPEATVVIQGTPTKDPWAKSLLTCIWVGAGVVGWLLWVYGPRFMFGFIERAIEERRE